LDARLLLIAAAAAEDAGDADLAEACRRVLVLRQPDHELAAFADMSKALAAAELRARVTEAARALDTRQMQATLTALAAELPPRDSEDDRTYATRLLDEIARRSDSAPQVLDAPLGWPLAEREATPERELSQVFREDSLLPPLSALQAGGVASRAEVIPARTSGEASGLVAPPAAPSEVRRAQAIHVPPVHPPDAHPYLRWVLAGVTVVVVAAVIVLMIAWATS
jgi:hypothetical protein